MPEKQAREEVEDILRFLDVGENRIVKQRFREVLAMVLTLASGLMSVFGVVSVDFSCL